MNTTTTEYRMRYRYVKGGATELICVPCFETLPGGLKAKYQGCDPSIDEAICHGCGNTVGGAR